MSRATGVILILLSLSWFVTLLFLLYVINRAITVFFDEPMPLLAALFSITSKYFDIITLSYFGTLLIPILYLVLPITDPFRETLGTGFKFLLAFLISPFFLDLIDMLTIDAPTQPIIESFIAFFVNGDIIKEALIGDFPNQTARVVVYALLLSTIVYKVADKDESPLGVFFRESKTAAVSVILIMLGDFFFFIPAVFPESRSLLGLAAFLVILGLILFPLSYLSVGLSLLFKSEKKSKKSK